MMVVMRCGLVAIVVVLAAVFGNARTAGAGEAIDLGSRRELFVDRHLVDHVNGARLKLHQWTDRGQAMAYDKPWEGPFSAGFTVIRDGGIHRLYYRGKARGVADGIGEVTCYAESTDGIRWTKPDLGIHELDGSKANNIVWMPDDMTKPDADRITHNFSPLLNQKPDADPKRRFLALAGYRDKLFGLASEDGLHWKKLAERPVMTLEEFGFDSQNVAFWSPVENKYVAYFRMWVKSSGEPWAPEPHPKHGIRSIARSKSDDFVNWTKPKLMSYGDTSSVVPSCHLYTNQTHPYFRAPHIYLTTAARFMPGRRVVTEHQAQKIGVDPKYFGDTSDAVLMTSRGGYVYDRTFLGALIAPGIGAENWVSRTNYPALNVVQTGSTEMSIYVSQNYAQPTAHLRRYSMRLDGFASVHADYDGGEMVTKPLTFAGAKLYLNFATSAAGGIRVEVQDAAGKPVPGFALDDCREVIGNEIERAVEWKGGDLDKLAGRPVRLRFVMKDADLFALRFGEPTKDR